MRSGFRRRRFGARGGRRAPAYWLRTPRATLDVSVGGPGPTASATSILTGAALEGNLASLDRRVTLLRLRINWSYVITTGFTAAANPCRVVLGIQFAGVGETAKDPAQVLAADQRADWLDLWYADLGAGTVNDTSKTLGYDCVRDIRAKRKIDADEALAVVGKLETLNGGALPAAGTVRISYTSSALFQETKR